MIEYTRRASPAVRFGLFMSVTMTAYGIVAGYTATRFFGPAGIVLSAMSGLLLGTLLQVYAPRWFAR